MQRPGFLAAALLVFGLTAAVADPSLHYDFVYDDQAVILERPPFWTTSVSGYLHSRPYGTGRHVVGLSLDLDRIGSGESALSPLAFHRTNILLASLLSVLVLAFGCRLGLSLGAATAAAAVFAVHPVHVDSVSWIVGRAETLAALGVVAALLVAIRPDGERRTAAASLRVFALTAFFGAFAVHSKENALCLPGLLLAARFFLGRRVAWLPALAGTTVAVASWFLLIGPLLAGFGKPQFVDNPLVYAAPLERILKSLAVLWRYASLLVWPHPLLLDRSWATTDPGLVEGWIAAAAWLAAGLGLVAMGRYRPRLAFALAWFPVSFAVTGNVLRPIGTLMAERLLMLPSLSACLAAGLAFDAFGVTPTRRRVACFAVVAVVAAFFLLFRERQAPWASGDLYFASSAAASPDSAKAQYDYGTWLLHKGDARAAEAAFARALAIVPSLSRAAQYEAESMAKRGDPAGGAEVYLAYLRSTPDDTAAITNLVRLLMHAHRPDEALRWAQRLVELRPGDASALDTLVIAEANVKNEAARAAKAAAPARAIPLPREGPAGPAPGTASVNP